MRPSPPSFLPSPSDSFWTPWDAKRFYSFGAATALFNVALAYLTGLLTIILSPSPTFPAAASLFTVATALMYLAEAWMYGVFWSSRTMSFLRTIHVVPAVVAGSLWTLATPAFILNINYLVAITATWSARSLPFWLPTFLLSTYAVVHVFQWLASFLLSYAAVHVFQNSWALRLPAHDGAAHFRAKIWRCHIPTSLLSQTYLAAFDPADANTARAYLMMMWVILTGCCLSLRMPSFLDDSFHLAMAVDGGKARPISKEEGRKIKERGIDCRTNGERGGPPFYILRKEEGLRDVHFF